MTKKYLMGEMTWPELKEAVAESRIAVVPVGCVEQHSHHLPLNTDIYVVDEICKRAGALVPEHAVIVPAIAHGHSPHHMDFPGTVTIDPRHMLDYVLDVCLSLSHHGFRKILLVNGHGSNAPVLDLAARQTIIRTEGRTACATMFHMDSHDFVKVATEEFPDLVGKWGHADAIETSFYLALRPELVQMDKIYDDPPTGLMNLGSAVLPLRLHWSTLSSKGVYGINTGASREKGLKLVEAAVIGRSKVFTEFYHKQIPERVDHH